MGSIGLNLILDTKDVILILSWLLNIKGQGEVNSFLNVALRVLSIIRVKYGG